MTLLVEVALALTSGVQRYGAQRPQLILYRRESDSAHQRGQFVGMKEARNGGRQVFVRVRVTGQQAPNLGQNLPAVPAIEIAAQAWGRLGEFQNRYSACLF